MNPSHVTNLDLSKALFEAGITKDYESEFYWVENTAIGSKDPAHGKVKPRSTCCMLNGKVTSSGCIKYTPSLLATELMGFLPWCQLSRNGEDWYVHTPDNSFVGSSPIAPLSDLATYLLREGKFNKPTTK